MEIKNSLLKNINLIINKLTTYNASLLTISHIQKKDPKSTINLANNFQKPKTFTECLKMIGELDARSLSTKYR